MAYSLSIQNKFGSDDGKMGNFVVTIADLLDKEISARAALVPDQLAPFCPRLIL